MKILLFIFLFISFSFSKDSIDKVKFSGLWYEIARVENKFQTSCVASSVEYVLEDDGTYNVFNRCFENELNPDYAIEKVHSWLFYNYRL